LVALSWATNVTVLVPLVSGTDAVHDTDVAVGLHALQVAVPEPPALLVHVTLVTPTLSLAVPEPVIGWDVTVLPSAGPPVMLGAAGGVLSPPPCTNS
jgi:hypothetical protein